METDADPGSDGQPEVDAAAQFEARMQPSDPSAHHEPSAAAAPRVSSPRKSAGKRTKKKAKTAKTSKTSKAAKTASAGPQRAPRYPRHSLEKALRIPRAIYEQNAGQPASRLEAVRFAGGNVVNGAWRGEISSAKKYGLLDERDGQLHLADRARRVLAPQSELDRGVALKDAIQDAPEFADVYNFYRGELLPETQYLTNTLLERFSVPPEKLGEFLQLFEESLRFAELLDESGPRSRVLDAGLPSARPVGAAAVAGAAPGGATVGRTLKGVAGSGDTCFVMQPFSGHLGAYYESVYRPAIEQAGLEPMRADNDLFGTGKIIDQVWRGINRAAVLVAELTSKNPNVFYELGIAHALHKPVVLVSSNEDDIPFDLRHIRVIVYDQRDPFWGNKLIDKVAENIRSAISHPEEAIFKIDQMG
ncbi:hypothetical protein [Kribbella sp.]|uniref:hypothetical protein n=1 Tax=Kribbella sp. TaxID=1871183 RepID=UPI002D36F320|nr:hypothetical protein [Kribbella sp.]HZX01600.1 hypothetical protein [Kribbella sp.]